MFLVQSKGMFVTGAWKLRATVTMNNDLQNKK